MHKKLLVLTLVIAAALLVGYYILFQKNKTPTNVPYSDNDISYTEATDIEKSESDRFKDVPTDNNEEPNVLPDTGKNKVNPFISVWRQESPGSDLRVNGFVPNIIESDGSCTLTLSKSNLKVTESQVSFQNAQDTTCAQIVVPYSKLTPGMWNATLIYSSQYSYGASAPTTIEIR